MRDPPSNCPKCGQPFFLSDSVEMHNYFDSEFGIWVIHWYTCDIEICEACEITGRVLNEDEFETPRDVKHTPREIWLEREARKKQRNES